LDIESIIVGPTGNPKLAAKFLRLAFHDCVGGCDGCVDLTNPENAGLLVPIAALRPIVLKHVKLGGVLNSRADLWALAATVAANVTQTKIAFKMDGNKRVDCENANLVCLNSTGGKQPCSDVRGPHRIIPGIDTNSHDLIKFFANEFGFSIKDTVAIMGAHTVGELSKGNSGVDGPNGWLLDNQVLNNAYYKELIGGTSASDSLDIHIDNAPGWTKGVETGNPNGIPDRNIWVGFPNGKKIIMLNVDVGLVRELNSTNMDKNGLVSCTFRRTGRCPANQLAIDFAIDYTFDNLLWLNDFRDVLRRMLQNGYVKTSVCDGTICSLKRE